MKTCTGGGGSKNIVMIYDNKINRSLFPYLQSGNFEGLFNIFKASESKTTKELFLWEKKKKSFILLSHKMLSSLHFLST